MVDCALLFHALHAHFVGFYVLRFVGKVYPWPRIGLLSLGEAVWDEPAQYISMRALETTRVLARQRCWPHSQATRRYSTERLDL